MPVGLSVRPEAYAGCLTSCIDDFQICRHKCSPSSQRMLTCHYHVANVKRQGQNHTFRQYVKLQNYIVTLGIICCITWS